MAYHINVQFKEGDFILAESYSRLVEARRPRWKNGGKEWRREEPGKPFAIVVAFANIFPNPFFPLLSFSF